jgi:diguanylate cyclase (GGDEF)-like protein
MTESLAAEIGKTRLFTGVTPETVERLLESCRVIEVSAGTVLIERERANDTVYVVLAGQLDVHLTGPHEPSFVGLGPGDCVGEMSIIDGRETSAYVVAKVACRLLAIRSEVIWSLIHTSHAVARNMLYILSGRLRFGNDAFKSSANWQLELESMAYVDALTGLHNRRWLDQAFRFQLERARNESKQLAILMIDIDHFKRYNDTHGHLAGDRSLCAVARALTENVRPGDLLARYGGEEFTVLLPDIDHPHTQTIAERLRHAAELAYSPEAPGLPRVTVSIGFAQSMPDDTLETMLARADSALYSAKNAGRNCVKSA